MADGGGAAKESHAGSREMKMHIEVSESARAALLGRLDEGEFLRLGVAPGGCAGMSYAAMIDREIGGNDVVIYEAGGLRVVADEQFSAFLDGVEIEFSNDLIRPGFVLRNPNVREPCGCGASFKAGGPGPTGGCCG
jgi:iron-sulfur cluster assembly protein